MFRDLIDAIMRLIFGHNTVENGKDWQHARKKADKSRAEVDAIITEANNNKKGK